MESLYTTIIETTPPTSETAGVIGQWYLDTTANKLYQYRSSGWEEIGAGGGSGAKMYQHNIVLYGNNDRIMFSFINNYSSAYTAKNDVCQAVIDLGYTNYRPLSATGFVKKNDTYLYNVVGFYGNSTFVAMARSSYDGSNFVSDTMSFESYIADNVQDNITELTASSGSTTRPHMHNIMCDQTTASGTWHYQFELENDVETAYTQTGQIGHYLFTKDSRLRIPATGLCTYNGDKYWITAVKATTDNMLTFEMYNIVDGTFKDDLSSGAVDVIDVVS